MHRRLLRYGSQALAITALACVSLPGATWAYTLLPLVTEQSQTLPSGTAEAIVGFSYLNNQRFPAFTQPGFIKSQTLAGLPQLSFRMAAGDWAEIQASYEVLYLDETAYSGRTNFEYGSGDARLYTKVRLLKESDVRPGVGVRFGAKLPNANRPARLGTDEVDFGIDALVSKDLGPLAVHANLGLLLLGVPAPFFGNTSTGGGQDDLLNYAIAVVSAPLGAPLPGATALRVLAEVAGQEGSHYTNERSSARVGIQLSGGAGTFYLGISTGLVSGSERIGASTGFIYTFEPEALFGGD